MATFNRPFGNNTPVTRVDDNDTPQQKKFEAATGKDSDGAVGDVPVKEETPVKEDTKKTEKAEESTVTTPKGVNKDVWAEAEKAALNQTGGFSGSTEEGRKAIIQDKYDQMVENDKNLKKWAGNEKGPGGILGDV